MRASRSGIRSFIARRSRPVLLGLDRLESADERLLVLDDDTSTTANPPRFFLGRRGLRRAEQRPGAERLWSLF